MQFFSPKHNFVLYTLYIWILTHLRVRNGWSLQMISPSKNVIKVSCGFIYYIHTAHGHVVHWDHAYISETLYLQMTTQIVIFIIHVLQQWDMDEQKTSSVLYNGFFEEGKFCNFTVLPALLLLTINTWYF